METCTTLISFFKRNRISICFSLYTENQPFKKILTCRSTFKNFKKRKKDEGSQVVKMALIFFKTRRPELFSKRVKRPKKGLGVKLPNRAPIS